MRIGILGTGMVATGLARYWMDHGHEVVFGSELCRPGLPTVPIAEAVSFAEVIVLALPFWAAGEALEAAGPMVGKVVLSCVSAFESNQRGLIEGTVFTVAEILARMAPEARMVSSMPVFAELLAGSPEGRDKPSVFVVGEDAEARRTASGLLSETGLDVIDAGRMGAAQTLEPAMALMLQVGLVLGCGLEAGWRLLPS